MFVEGYGGGGAPAPDNEPENISLLSRVAMLSALGIAAMISENLIREFFEGFTATIHNIP